MGLPDRGRRVAEGLVLSRRLGSIEVMTHLIESLAVPVLDGEPEGYRYDESRHLNVGSDGQPFVLEGRSGGTVTVTKVSSENDDTDAMATTTNTRAGGESEDRD